MVRPVHELDYAVKNLQKLTIVETLSRLHGCII